MPRTRDIIEEIAEVRQRRRFDSTMAELPVRLFALENAFKGHDQTNAELTRYFPVALVACIEGYFRLAIKELVDAGEPYLSNAERPVSSLKLDFAVIRAIHGKTVTVGELVGHIVPLSRLDHIEYSMSGLLGTSFLARMREVTDRFAHEVRGEPLQPILTSPDKVFSGVAKTFELRHIICHELATAHEIEYHQVAQCFENCVTFLKAADEIVSETLHPNAALTQSDMNIAAGDSLAKARQELHGAVAELRSYLSGDDLVAFDASQAAWEQYCNAWAEFDALEVKGGTMWSTLRASSEEALVRSRTEDLRAHRSMDD
jgi:uncharacterized protein YecT (DUF1311 family)